MSRFSSRSEGSEGSPGTAWHDPLTGALTRQHFLSLLAEEQQHADDNGEPFGLFLADVDGLKAINDGWGQSAGDGVLAALADELRTLLGKPPWHEIQYSYARFDGGSIVLLARGRELEFIQRLAETLRQRVAESPLVEGITVTLSISVTQYRIGEPIDELVSRVERTLHLAKQFGRDRVECAPAAPQSPRRATVVRLGDGSRPGRRDM
jgi:diguanylate cyclase (GGDEF)-like protein